MPKARIRYDAGAANIPLLQAEGKPLRSLQVYHAVDAVAIDLRFDDGLSLELLLHVAVEASATLLRFANGSARVVAKVKPIKQQ